MILFEVRKWLLSFRRTFVQSEAFNKSGNLLFHYQPVFYLAEKVRIIEMNLTLIDNFSLLLRAREMIIVKSDYIN